MRASFLNQIARPLAQSAPQLLPSRRFPILPGEERPAALPAVSAEAIPTARSEAARPPHENQAAVPPQNDAPSTPVPNTARPEPSIVAPAAPRAAPVPPQRNVGVEAATNEVLATPGVSPPPPEFIVPVPAEAELPPVALPSSLPPHLADDSRSLTADPASRTPPRADVVPSRQQTRAASTVVRPVAASPAESEVGERIAGEEPPRSAAERSRMRSDTNDLPPPSVPAREPLPAAPPLPRAVALPPSSRAGDGADRTVRIGSIEVRVTPAPTPPAPPAPSARAPAPAPSAAAPLSRGFTSAFGLRQG